MGHRIAFGNTAERYRYRYRYELQARSWVVRRAEMRRSGTQGPLRHDTRVGWVAKHEGQYRDALSHRTKVYLMLVESLDGIYSYYSFKLQLQPTLAKRAVEVSAVDRTRYSRATAGPRSIMQHNCQRLSSAPVMMGAAAICKDWRSQAVGLS
jgi:hypothetical protein